MLLQIHPAIITGSAEGVRACLCVWCVCVCPRNCRAIYDKKYVESQAVV